MTADRPTLTDRQRAVLQWIADGCRGDAWPDHSHKLLVVRLETLNLASVRRRSGTWHAVLQPDGQYYLQHGHYPERPPTAAAQRPRPIAPVPATAATLATAATRATVTASRPKTTKPASPTEQLITRIVAAGGTLTVSPANDAERRRLEAQIHAAQRHGKAPAGLHLVVERPRWSTFVLHLRKVPAWMAEPVPEIRIPAQLRRPHDAIMALSNDEHRFAIQGASRRRALLLLQALIDAAHARGHRAAAGRSDERFGHRGQTRPHLVFTVAGHQVGLRIAQLKDRTEHVPTTRELTDKRRYSYYSIPRYDYTPGDRLKLEITEFGAGTWTDGVRTNLEDRLGDVLRAIERAADAAERARLASEERQRQERLENEQRVSHATLQLVQAHRAQVLETQLASWHRARQLDDYVTAMTAVVEQIEDPEQGVAAAEWLDWIRQHARAIDPLQNPIALPADPAPTDAALAPFMERPAPRW